MSMSHSYPGSQKFESYRKHHGCLAPRRAIVTPVSQPTFSLSAMASTFAPAQSQKDWVKCYQSHHPLMSHGPRIGSSPTAAIRYERRGKETDGGLSRTLHQLPHRDTARATAAPRRDVLHLGFVNYRISNHGVITLLTTDHFETLCYM